MLAVPSRLTPPNLSLVFLMSCQVLSLVTSNKYIFLILGCEKKSRSKKHQILFASVSKSNFSASVDCVALLAFRALLSSFFLKEEVHELFEFLQNFWILLD